jgi:hypothetical protein
MSEANFARVKLLEEFSKLQSEKKSPKGAPGCVANKLEF